MQFMATSILSREDRITTEMPGLKAFILYRWVGSCEAIGIIQCFNNLLNPA